MRGGAGGMEAGGWGGPRVGIGIGLGPYWGPYGGPYWGGYWRPYAYGYPYAYPYAYPPVVTVPSTQLYVQPSAPAARPAPSTSLLGIIAMTPGVLPLRAAMPRGMAGGRPYATISPRLQVPLTSCCAVILRPKMRQGGKYGFGYPPPLGVDCGAAWGFIGGFRCK